MFSYLSLGCSDLQRAARFYDAALAPLGLQRCTPGGDGWDDWIGWGTYLDDGREELALWLCKPFNGEPPSIGNGSMIALRAHSWQAVRDFHQAALAHGGRCDGPPGLRLHYGADFFSAYVRDPDGHKLAAVCRGFTADPALSHTPD
ncbi:VOC family protein [Pseudomonas fulva]|uniref:Glyoxalase/bleomycin resistance protein/dioxygenase n=1 Tax=Pseudomonas fulva (strain 12-X) TaxID=743720 RepID=F6A954_PSEF1|nr:VOC family protein [Pseudomonas fulva]AEF21981.1 Glyoxalase/bleomycin resistance protein/dioxygenase [Pseudomonas fulva 12-X]